ncbi:energy transducer TonB family protein [Acinetobacter baumannii]|uniref:energy transducer TonB family protein n=1 Tax=Acinetobacter baumannii TaxID=470 RepID=UPI001EE89406|nr:energy transducer TonB [Acinetobacter baumannii]MCG5790305.1 TonB family protein [Acinetobacter baumannii]
MKNLITIFLCSFFILPFCAYANDSKDNVKEMPPNLKWKQLPKINMKDEDLQGYDRVIMISADANERGVITSAKVMKSSGIEKLDIKVLIAIKNASFYPYQENGIYYPIRFMQPLDLKLSRKPKFKNFPKIIVNKSYIKGQERKITIYSEADKNGNLTLAKIKRSSGVPELDTYVLEEFRKKAQFYPLIVNGSPYPIREES